MEERIWVERLRKGDKEVFSLLFTLYYKDFVLFAATLLEERVLCEDIVQSVFLKCWTDRERLAIETSLKSYFLKAIRNRCLDEIRHRRIVREHVSSVVSQNVLEDVDTENYILYADLESHLRKALAKLPVPCRKVFEMNRLQGLKHKEIAERLDVSVRTVEARLGKALELLGKYLKDFLPAIFVLILNNVIRLWK